MSQLTAWFSGVEVPERVGVYERQMHTQTFFSYWNGKQWWPGDVTPQGALLKYWRFRELGVPRWVSQLLSWRGLLEADA